MRILKNPFLKNVITLMTGTAFSQVIPIIISPILTRIYSPADFGILALFTTIVIIFGNISNAKYELAIVLPEKEEEAMNLVALSILISFLFCILLYIIVEVFHNQFILLVQEDRISKWLYIVPCAVFIVALFNTLNYLNIRKERFGRLSQAYIQKSLIGSTTQIIIGIFKKGPSGLIIGSIFSYITLNISLGFDIFTKKTFFSVIDKKKFTQIAKRYRNFPKFSLPASLSSTLSLNLINIFIPIIYSTSTLGFLALVYRVLNIPLDFLGNSVKQVYMKTAVKEFQSKGSSIELFDSILKKLLFISLPGSLLLFIIVEDLFELFFGKEWRTAGTFCKILLPLFLIRLIAIPLSITLEITGKQKYNFLWQTGLLILNITIFTFSYYFKIDIKSFLTIYSLLISIYYGYLLYISRMCSKNVNYKKHP